MIVDLDYRNMIASVPGPCAVAREIASARLDGEFFDEQELDSVDRHIEECSSCAQWVASATAIHRSLRLSASEDVPDLSAQIMMSVRREQLVPAAPSVLPMARLGLIAMAFAITLGVAGEIGTTGWTNTHTSQELLAFQLAFAGGYVAAAIRPRWAGGIAVSSVITAAVLVITAVSGVRSGETSGTIEFNHVLEVIGAVLACVVARLAGTAGLGTVVSRRRLTT